MVEHRMRYDVTGLRRAREALAKGRSLNEAAQASGIPARELDILLWRGFGHKSAEKTDG